MQWFGTLNDSMTDKTLTLREIYEYASWAERASLEDFHIKKTAISFNILLVLQKLRRYKNNDILAGSHACTDKTPKWHYGGGGGGGGNGAIAHQPPPPPASLVRRRYT